MVEIIRTKKDSKFKVILYGNSNIGKSFTASLLPKSIFLDCEDGLKGIPNTVSTPKLNSYTEVVDALRDIIKMDEFDTVIIDSLSKINEYIEQMVLVEWNQENPTKKVNNPQKIAYGGATSIGFNHWLKFLEILNIVAQKKNIVLLSHVGNITVKDPTVMEDYERSTIAINKKAVNTLLAEVDGCFYMRKDVMLKGDDDDKKRGLSNDKVYLYTTGSVSYDAKSRFPSLPAKIARDDFKWDLINFTALPKEKV